MGLARAKRLPIILTDHSARRNRIAAVVDFSLRVFLSLLASARFACFGSMFGIILGVFGGV